MRSSTFAKSETCPTSTLSTSWQSQRLTTSGRTWKASVRVVELDEIQANQSRLSIPLYVKTHSDDGDQRELPEVLGEWLQSSNELRASMDDLFEMLDEFNDNKE